MNSLHSFAPLLLRSSTLSLLFCFAPLLLLSSSSSGSDAPPCYPYWLMVLPNPAFDALMWGLLLVAALVDGTFPQSHGFASLLVLVGATYWAAQELGEFLTRRVGWSQESLATSLAPCAALFIYFIGRNSSDFSLLLLSIALMMGSLMVTISLLAAISMLVREGRSVGITGWIATSILSLCLGVAAGVAAILLGQDQISLILKIGALVGAFALWKTREMLSPPPINPHAALSVENGAASAPVRPALFPQRGTLLDRLIPVALLGVLLAFAVMRGTFSLGGLNQPAVASQPVQPVQVPQTTGITP